MKKILVVEDDKAFREILVEFLEAYGFEVVWAANGDDAIDMIASAAADLMIADVLLPRVTGFQLCERIRSGPSPRTPIVLMSALYKTAKMKQDAHDRFQVADYWVKPFGLAPAAAALCALLGTTKEELQAAKADALAEKVAANEEKKRLQAAARPTALDAVPEQGSFERYAPAYVLTDLLRRGATGVLDATSRKAAKKVYFRAGDPIYLTSNLLEETFGQMMIQDGVIAADLLDMALNKSKQDGTLLGRTLVAEGLIDQSVLSHYLIREVSIRLTKLITWRSGEFRFEPGEAFLEKIRRPSMRLLGEIYRYALAGGLDADLRERYSGCHNARVVKIEEQLHRIGEAEWTPDDLAATAFIDGEHTLGEILDVAGRQSLDLYRVVGVLELGGVVRLE